MILSISCSVRSVGLPSQLYSKFNGKKSQPVIFCAFTYKKTRLHT